MYVAEVLTALDQAVKRAFHEAYPVEEFRNLYSSIEYPVDQAKYPCVWVGFEPRGTLSIAGINHREFYEDPETGTFGEVTRWRFEGQAIFTIVSMSSLARARLMDEMIRVIGFRSLEKKEAFGDWINENPIAAITLNYDHIGQRGMSENQGTPWGTDQMLYEVTLAVDMIGEFTSTPMGKVVPLSEIIIKDEVDNDLLGFTDA